MGVSGFSFGSFLLAVQKKKNNPPGRKPEKS